MPTSKIPVTSGSGLNVGTYSISEDAVTKELQRVVLSNSSGSDISSFAITSFPSFAAGSSVTVTSLPSFAADASVKVTSLPSLAITSLPALAAGSSVVITSLPNFAAGASVNITSLPAFSAPVIMTFPAGASVIITGTASVIGTVTVTGSALAVWQKTCKSVTTRSTVTISLIPATATKRLKIYAFDLITEGINPTRVTFSDGLSTGAALATYSLQAFSATNFGISKATTIPTFLFATTAGNPLEMTFSGSNVTLCNISYWDDDVT